MTATRDRVRIGLLGCVIAAVSLAAIGLVVLLVIAAVPDRVGLLLSVTAASIPALIYDLRCSGSEAYVRLARELMSRLPRPAEAA